MKYSATITNLWFGAPSEDESYRLAPVVISPFTLDAAREAVAKMGYTPTCTDDDEIETALGYAQVNIAPTERGAENAWVFFTDVWYQ